MPTDSDSNFTPRPELSHLISHDVSALSDCNPPSLEHSEAGIETAVLADKKKLLYHIDKVTAVHHFCIPPLVATEIITLAPGTGHPGFSQCFKIITFS